MSSIDIVATTGKLIDSCVVLVLPPSIDPTTFEGVRNHLEFCTEELRMLNHGEYPLPADEKHRGVFGYVTFGLGGGTNLDGSTNFPKWLPGQYINWGRNLFYPQDGKMKDNVRIWLRKGVKAHIFVYEADPQQTSLTWSTGP